MQHKMLKFLFPSLGIGLLLGLLAPVALADYWQTSITPNVSDWPQRYNDSVNGSWCGAAVLQAKIDWDWSDHRQEYNHFSSQETLWSYARDYTCSDIVAKGVQGRDTALPGQVGNGWYQVRKLNIAYDFGLDPHAVAWMLWKYGPDYYHYWIYNDVGQATWALLWTLENHHEPVVAAVGHGNHLVLAIGYHALRRATDDQGLGEIYAVRYADPLYGPGTDTAYRWRDYSTGTQSWIGYFSNYTDPHDPDPATGWYVPPPAHWYGHWVTIERDEYTTYSPDWAMGPSGPITPYYWPYHNYLPAILIPP